MKTITLDIANIHTVRALHIYLQYMLDLPEYYGRNLDALYDCLTDVSEPTHIVLCAKGVHGEMCDYLPKLLRVLRDAADACASLTLTTDC